MLEEGAEEGVRGAVESAGLELVVWESDGGGLYFIVGGLYFLFPEEAVRI